MTVSPGPLRLLVGAGAATGAGAVRAAAEQAIGGLQGREVGLLLAFPSVTLDASEIARQLAAAADGGLVAGMTGSGLVAAGGPLEDGCTALAFDRGVRAGVGVVERASGGLYDAGRAAAVAALDRVDAAPHRLLLLFLDTRSGDQAHAVAGAYSVAGPVVPLTGGAAGGASAAQFAGAHAYQDSVVAVAIGSENPIGVGIAHGCARAAVPAIVTRSDDRWLQRLDGRPAETVYLEKLGIGNHEMSDLQFEALAACHPLAQPELSGEVRLRHVLGRGGDGSLRCATALPANSAVEFTVQQPEWIISSAYDAVSAALAPLNGERARAALVFDCAGRKRALGGALAREVAALVGSFGKYPPPLAGLYTHGEIGRVRGAKGDRNHVVVVVAFG